MVEQVHGLDAADEMCPACGGELSEWVGNIEDSEEVDVVERSFCIVRYCKKRYRCKCGSCVEIALGLSKLVPSGRYSLNFALAVAADKYGLHLPLARQVRLMAEQGLQVTTQTLWDQLVALVEVLRPSYDALRLHILAAPVVLADETTWPVLGGGKRGNKGSSKWWAWAVANQRAVYYLVQQSRSADAAAQLLGDYHGTVIADGYAAYTKLRNDRATLGPVYELASCWAHATRKFAQCEDTRPEAKVVLDLIGEL